MNQAAKSIYYFSFWPFLNGLFLLLAPNVFLGIVGIDSSASIVARLFGMVLLFLSFYYFMAGRNPAMAPFYAWTIYTRMSAPLFVSLIVIYEHASPIILLFVSIDVIGALWTLRAVRDTARN